jgi:hypothetical protein
MAERRHTARKKSFLRGCLYFNKRRSAVDCLIRDISNEGARVVFSDAVSVPDMVELYIPQKEETILAHVQWRHADELGLAFPDSVSAPFGDLAERVEKLELEVAALRRLLKQMKSEMPGGRDDAA